MNKERKTLISQLAESYVSDAQGVLMAALGEDVGGQDMAAFGERAVSVLGALVFSTVYEKLGKAEAEKWISTTLSQMSAHSRMMGTPALLRIQAEVKEAANPFRREVPEEAPPLPAPAPAENPVVLPDPKKREECASKLIPIVRDSIYPVKKMSEVGDRLQKMSGIYSHGDLDYALSKAIPLLFRDGVETAEKILAALASMFGMVGVQELPITTKAWEAEIKERVS